MKYMSTRGGVRGLSFQDALFTGYASDGGILLPETIPKVSQDDLVSWKDLGFADLANKIIPMFIPDSEIPRPDLEGLIQNAFKTFSCPEVAPISRLQNELNILELFHGKTWAFKDVALSVVGQFYNYFCSKSKTHYTIVVGTSGDTGSAAIEAVRGMEWVDIVVLLPRGRCSHIQEKQMTTAIADNVHVFRVDGTSDDLDVSIKACFMDTAFRDKHHLTSINSINWARIMIQTVHYFYAYLKMCPACDRTVEIVIPTGACGNVTSGCVAKMMGLNIEMVCAVTCNDIVARAVSRGDFSMSPDVKQTLAPAMDIQIPYNMERLWYIFSGGDTALVSSLMEEFEKNGSVTVPEELSKKISGAIIETFVASDDDVKSTMKRVWEDNSYRVCPHTSIAAAYHYKHSKRENVERICIATASVTKFTEAVLAAGLVPEVDDRVTALDTMETKYTDMEKGQDWEKMLRDKIIEISAKI